MYKEIIIHQAPEETIVAVLEEFKLVEVYMEGPLNERLVGNIYRGKVANVLPGMQAAFVDIGLKKNAFLYVQDLIPGKEALGEGEKNPSPGSAPPINELLKVGQYVTVQVTKEPFGDKGAKVTTNITLPGRYLVLMPTMDYIGISRRIEAEQERERLKKITREILPPGMGAIVRTVAAGVSAQQLAEDFHHLHRLWLEIKSKEAQQSPGLIHRDLLLSERVLRDTLAEDVSRIVVNSQEVYRQTIEFAGVFAPYLQDKILLKEGADLLTQYNILPQIEQALKRKVWLDCGGYLIIDQVEALTVIDVNTGKFVGRTNLTDTVLKTNLEAAVEIARQLRLRNIGGIVIIDFIDMPDYAHREQVLKTLENELKKDKTRTTNLGITNLGLVELTRKKSSQSISSFFQRDCPYCQGRGQVLSEETVAFKARKQIMTTASSTEAPILLVEAHPAVAALLIGAGGTSLKQLEKRTGKKIVVRGQGSVYIEEIKITPIMEEEQLKAQAAPLRKGEILQVRIEEPFVGNPQDGIARLDGYIIIVKNGSDFIGLDIMVEIVKVSRTAAHAVILKEK